MGQKLGPSNEQCVFPLSRQSAKQIWIEKRNALNTAELKQQSEGEAVIPEVSPFLIIASRKEKLQVLSKLCKIKTGDAQGLLEVWENRQTISRINKSETHDIHESVPQGGSRHPTASVPARTALPLLLNAVSICILLV